MIAVIIPTIREEKYQEFIKAWSSLFEKHNVKVYKVTDGKNPNVNGISVKEVMGKYSDLIYNFNDGVRNLGFAKAYQDGADYLLTLDDDTLPVGDTIQDHLDALSKRYPISWINTTCSNYMRGFPYWLRQESECVLSHGNWTGVADFDSPTQLVLGTPTQTLLRIPIPKGIFYPMCIMNCAIKRKLLPYFYQAPAYDKFQRFSDIWCGVESKKIIDSKGWCVVTGYATVQHNRASNVFTNLKKESVGIEMNERYFLGDESIETEYIENYKKCRERWKEFIQNI